MRTLHNRIGTLAPLALCFCFFTLLESLTLAAPPNVVFILADDLGIGDVKLREKLDDEPLNCDYPAGSSSQPIIHRMP